VLMQDVVFCKGWPMLKIRRSANRRVVFALSGRMSEDNIAELEALISLEKNGRAIVLDLKDVTLVGREAIKFLERCEANGITLRNCPAYVREWITRQRRGR
jgi:anti-anti-sigma regulatory factor